LEQTVAGLVPAKPACHRHEKQYRPGMKRWYFLLITATATCWGLAGADVVELKDNASVTGRILAEKPDQLVLDIGYTVLTVPKTFVVRVATTEAASAPAPKAKAAGAGTRKAKAAPTESAEAFYSTASGSRPERSVRELVSQLGASVVQVRTPGGLGSGFIINEDGYLITNFHVVESETKITVEVYHLRGGQLERKNYKDIRIVAMNKFADLALLKIEDEKAPRFSRISLGDADALAVGERVFAIGSPLGLERTVTEGIVSTKTRQMQGALYLQTTAQINPGNSGGPLFNLRGEVVGVTNMKITFGEGLGFAIPVSEVKHFLDHRDAFAYDAGNPSNPYRYLEPPSRTRQSPEKPAPDPNE
jgi:serine protease Do